MQLNGLITTLPKELKLLIYNLNQIKLQKMKDFEVIISDDSPSNIVEKYDIFSCR